MMISRSFWLFLFALLTAGVPSSDAAERLYREFPVGHDANQVGIVAPDSTGDEEVQLDGPQAITSDPEGNIYLLDQLNNRILKFSSVEPENDPQILELPEGTQSTDIVFVGGELFAWDGAARKLDGVKNIENVVKLSSDNSIVSDDVVVSAFAQMGSQAASLNIEEIQKTPIELLSNTKRIPTTALVFTNGMGPVAVEYTPFENEQGVKLAVESLDKKFQNAFEIRTRDKLGAIEFLQIDSQSHSYVLVENVPSEMGIASSMNIVMIDPDGTQKSQFHLPLEKSIAPVRRFSAVTSAGNVFLLSLQTASAQIFQIDPDPISPKQVLGESEDIKIEGPQDQQLAGVLGRRRADVINTALPFADERWKVTEETYGNEPDRVCTGFNPTRIRRPWFMQGKIGETVQGLPYCWGCKVSVDEFKNAASNGRLAGNVCTKENPRRELIGVDCSSFVSESWGLSSHHTTRMIPTISEEIAASELQPGDVLNKPGSHVMLFLRLLPNRKVQVIEAATSSCAGRVCVNEYFMTNLRSKGFVPRRFLRIAN